MLQHFRNRDDVIRFAMDHLPRQYRSIARSFEDGKVEFLGGFSSDYSYGWMIKVTSKFNKVYYIYIRFKLNSEIRLSVLNQIDWKLWDGNKSDNPLYQGDNPDKYRRLKIATTKNE